MKYPINTVYLLILVICTFGFLFLLQYIQKSVLSDLNEVLYKQKNPEKYLNMLGSKRLGLVLRKGTILLLELNGRLLTGDPQAIQKVYNRSAELRMSKNEKLNLYLKLFNYFVQYGSGKLARELYRNIEGLLKEEKDSKLKAILSDSRILLGVYIDRDISLIGELIELRQKQTGSMRGLTDYRLAKLYWYAGNKEKSLECLGQAKEMLMGTAWEQIILQAVEQPELLEKV